MHTSLKREAVTPQSVRQTFAKTFCFVCAFLSILTTLGIILVLIFESVNFFRVVSPVDFFFGTRWAPLFKPEAFGVLPLICGTFLVAIGAGLIAIPIGLFSGIYLSEYASPRARSIIKPALEVLAGVPTVVYGYFAIAFVTPILRQIFPNIDIFNAASAAIVVGIMILPMISSLCEDALSAVPKSLREGAYALGATKLEVTMKVVVPAALSGIVSAFILAISRAVGETMAVTLAAGATPKLTYNFGESIQTMTAYIVQVSLGDTPADSVAYQTIFAVGLTLFAITMVMNIIAMKLVKRFRSIYE
ncbi:MAG: phosphate ABC transporter permease subunit PstC [Candidatus Nitrosotenuis sp.]